MNLQQQQLESFVECLRAELQGYGELLALMETQQSQIMSRDLTRIESTTQKINEQFKVIQDLRKIRSNQQAQISISTGLVPDATYKEQRDFFPNEFRNLTDALVEENNALLKEVKVKAKQNQMLLFRTTEMMQEFINHLLPRNEVQSYNAKGAKQSTRVEKTNLYEAMG